MSDDNIVKFTKKYVAPQTTERFLTVVHSYKCIHGNYIVDPDKAEVECGKCHERLNPIKVLVELAHKECKYHDYHKRFIEQSKKMDERTRVKCSHCGQFTKVNS